MDQHAVGDARGDVPADVRSVLVPVAPSSTLRETVEYVVNSTLDELEADDASQPTESDPLLPGERDVVASDATAAESDTTTAASDTTATESDSNATEPDAAAAEADASDASDSGSVTDDADDAGNAPQVPVVHFVYVHAPEEFDPDEDAPEFDDADDLLDRVRVWAKEDAGEHSIDVRTGHLGGDRYLFSPADVAASLVDAARDRGADRIVLDPEYDPGVGTPLLRPLAYELSRDATLTIEEAPVQHPTRRAPLVGRSSARRIGALAGLSFLFYQVLAGSISAFDLVTGSVTAVVVAVSLSRVSFGRDPTPTETPIRLLRTAIYVPYLLWEIVVANVLVAAVILNPRQDIDPRMTRIRPAVYGALPVTTLANSITLTPGTLTVRVQGRELLVHTLIPAAREDLFDGSLERAVRFVFYGRRAMRIDSLEDRGVAELVPIGGGGSTERGEES